MLAHVREYCALDRHEYDEGRIRAALEPLLRGDRHGIVLISDAGGYAVLTWGWSLESGGREALLDEIYVAERGRGHGARLLEAVLEAARRAGAAAVFLETEEHNDRVRRFYQRNGFAAEPSVWMRRPLAD